MKKLRIKDLQGRELAPGIFMRPVHLEKVMMTFIDLKAGRSVPLHSHPHEQITVMVSGEMVYNVDGEEQTVTPGDVVLIPSGVKHGVRVITDSVAYDCFSPIREDYLMDK